MDNTVNWEDEKDENENDNINEQFQTELLQAFREPFRRKPENDFAEFEDEEVNFEEAEVAAFHKETLEEELKEAQENNNEQNLSKENESKIEKQMNEDSKMQTKEEDNEGENEEIDVEEEDKAAENEHLLPEEMMEDTPENLAAFEEWMKMLVKQNVTEDELSKDYKKLFNFLNNAFKKHQKKSIPEQNFYRSRRIVYPKTSEIMKDLNDANEITKPNFLSSLIYNNFNGNASNILLFPIPEAQNLELEGFIDNFVNFYIFENDIAESLRGLQKTDMDSSFRIILRSDIDYFPKLFDQASLRFILNYDHLFAQKYFFRKKFEVHLSIDDSDCSYVYLRSVEKFFESFPSLVNWAGCLKAWNSNNSKYIDALFHKIMSNKTENFLWINIVPFLLKNDSQNSSVDYLPMVKNMIRRLTLTSETEIDISEFKARVIQLLSQTENYSFFMNILNLMTHFEDSETRTRAFVIYLLILDNLENEETLKTLVCFFQEEFGMGAFQHLIHSNNNMILSSHLKIKIDLNEFINKKPTINAQFKTSKILTQFFDIHNKVGFEGHAFELFKFPILEKRVCKSIYLRAFHNMNYGEYIALNQTSNKIKIGEVLTNTEYSKFVKKTDSCFNNNFNYLSSVVDFENLKPEKELNKQETWTYGLSSHLKKQLFKSSFKKMTTNPKRKFGGIVDIMDDFDPNETNYEDKKSDESANEYSMITDRKLENILKTEEDLESLKISLQDYIESNLDKKAQSRIFLTLLFYESLFKERQGSFEKKPSNSTLASELINEFFFENSDERKDNLSFSFKSSLGEFNLDLNDFNVNNNLFIPPSVEVIERILKTFKLEIKKTQLFVLLNIYMNLTTRSKDDLNDKFFEFCHERRWPKALIEILHLQVNAKFITRKSLESGIRYLCAFRFYNVEIIDLFIAYAQLNNDQGISFDELYPVFESMIINEQLNEFNLRFQEIKMFIINKPYVDNLTLPAQENETLEKEFNAAKETKKVEFYSRIFDLAVKYDVVSVSTKLFNEMLSLKQFKTSFDVMNIVRFSADSGMNMNLSLEYIYKEIMYNNLEAYPEDFEFEVLEISEKFVLKGQHLFFNFTFVLF